MFRKFLFLTMLAALSASSIGDDYCQQKFGGSFDDYSGGFDKVCDAGDGLVFNAPLVDSTTATTGQTATFARASSATYIDSSTGLIKTALTDVARFESDGYLSEPAGTNLALYSEAFDNANWTKSNCSIVANSIASPDGNSTADTIHEDTSAATTHKLYQSNIALTSGSAYAISLYVKAANRDWIWLRLYNASDSAHAYYDVANETVGVSGANTTPTIENIGNGWMRCVFTFTATQTANYGLMAYAAEADNDYTFDGLDQDSLYIWGAQVEESPIATSYIATTSAAVTRAKDVLSYAFAAPATGAVSATIKTQDYADTTYAKVFSLNDGGSSNAMRFYIDYTGNRGVFNVKSGGTNYATLYGTTDLTDGSSHTLSVWFGPTLNRLYIDGSQEGSDDTSATIPTTTIFEIGQNFGLTQLNGHISEVKVYNRQVTP